MGLWTEVKRGAVGSAGGAAPSGPNLEAQPRDWEPGLERMRKAGRQISDAWNEIESSGGSIAWEWILRGSAHGPKIQAAEDRVNAIGSRGDPAALASACDSFVAAWREGIEGWKAANGSTKAEQGLFSLGKQASMLKGFGFVESDSEHYNGSTAAQSAEVH